jgi:hypothetical protein
MIRATIKSTGQLINKPRFSYIDIVDEDQLAIQRKNEETNKVEQFTIRELFDFFSKNSIYEKNMGERESSITTDLWETWFMGKYIRGKNIENNIIGVTYERI